EFRSPAGLAIDRATGELYVAELAGHRVRKIANDAAADVSTVAGTGVAGYLDAPPMQAQFNSPSGVALDPPSNATSALIADYGNAVIRVIDLPITAASSMVATVSGTTPGYNEGLYNQAQFNGPSSVAIDGVPFLYVADENNFRIRRVDMAGTTSPFVGDGVNGFKDGAGSGAELSRPLGLCFDGTSRIYVADSANHRIRSVDFGGSTLTLAGSGASGDADGPNLQASFTAPSAVAVDAAGDLFVTDASSGLVRRVSFATGRTDTIAGTGQAAPFSDGTGCAATFNGPRGIVSAPGRVLYVADTGNQRIRKIQY